MTRKLETGDYVAERDPALTPANRLRPKDYEAERRTQESKDAAFRKP